LKGDVEALLGLSADAEEIAFRPVLHPALHPGQAAEVLRQGRRIGVLGSLHPALQAEWELPDTPGLFELYLSRIPGKSQSNYQKISKYPAIRRDISLVIDAQIPAAEVLDCIGASLPDVLNKLELFDVYQGEGIDSGKKSLALGLTFQRSSSTLTDEEADAAVGGILDSLHGQFGAILRE